MADRHTPRACHAPDFPLERSEARVATNEPEPLDIVDPDTEDRKMPDAAYVAQPECVRNSQNEKHVAFAAMPLMVMRSDTQERAIDHYLRITSRFGVDRGKCVNGKERWSMEHREHGLEPFPSGPEMLGCAVREAGFFGINYTQFADLVESANVSQPEDVLCAVEDIIAIIEAHEVAA